jgi:hypothetical protein
MAPATTTARPTVNVPHHIIDIHVPGGPLRQELLAFYQTLHPSRRLWTETAWSFFHIRLELRHPRCLPAELNDSRRTEVRLYAEHHGPGHGYLEGTPFLMASGLWLTRPGLSSQLPLLGRFIRRQALLLQMHSAR